MAHWTSLSEAVRTHIHDGDTVALEGFTHLIPFAAGHEIIRQGIRNLSLIRMTPDVIYDQLIGAGCARKLTFSWGGNPGVGSLHRLRDAVEQEWPHALELEERSHADLANAYVAGAANLPFAIMRGYSGSDLPKFNKQIRTITLSVHRGGTCGDSGSPSRCRCHPRSEGGCQGQCTAVGNSGRPEGSRACIEAGDCHR
jgi:glutaconate CoA-transferase subunit A